MRPWKPKRRVVAARRGAYALVDARAGDRCEMCGAHAPVGAREHSHRSHAGIGGSPASLRASNLLLSCAGHDPATTPVLLHAGWVTLNDEGTYTPTKETL
jgi:hypothetical protein